MRSPPPVSPLSRSPAANVLFLVLLGAPAPAGDVRLDVSGQVRADAGRLVVRVDVLNRGEGGARGLRVEGELRGARREAVVTEALPAHGTRSVELAFPGEVPRPGVYPLELHLRYSPDSATANAPAASQRAYLLLAVGANPGPSVRIAVPDARLARHTVVPIRLESADGAAHRVTLRALAPRGLNALAPEEPVQVPATGAATAPLTLLRVDAPPNSQAGIVVMAAEVDGPLERTAAATSRVEVVAPSAPWLPRLRVPLLVSALSLLAAAVLRELWSFRSRSAL
jgi:hypothetical protein